MKMQDSSPFQLWLTVIVAEMTPQAACTAGLLLQALTD